MNSLFLVVSFYLYLLWEVELNEPIYNPLFSTNHLDFFPKYIIKIKIINNKFPETTYDGFLTNWNDASCFIKLMIPLKLEGNKIMLVTELNNRKFEHGGEIVTILDNHLGIGVSLNLSTQAIPYKFNWFELFSALDDMGYLPKYLA